MYTQLVMYQLVMYQLVMYQLVMYQLVMYKFTQGILNVFSELRGQSFIQVKLS